MRLLVDGVFFQIANTGIARVWATILPLLAQRGDFDITLLDRGRAPDLPGIRRMPFPTYTGTTAADSALLQTICDELAIDVFTSTYYTTPFRVPMALMLYDMIPELMRYDTISPLWTEKTLTIAYAQRFLCISHQTRADLLQLHPDIHPDRVQAVWCGIDRTAFYPRGVDEITAFRARNGLTRDYYIFVGNRGQARLNYKNGRLFFAALPHLLNADFDVVCVGGETDIDEALRASLPPGMGIQRLALSDDDLACAYGGATALVYPSLYEGFGLPPVEAMATGCPVITTARGSLAEVTGDAALHVEGTSIPEMAQALVRIRDPGLQAHLRKKGVARAALFDWAPMADALARQLHAVHAETRDGSRDAFWAEWERLRRIQAELEE